MNKKIIIIVVIILALALAGGAWWFFNATNPRTSGQQQIQRVAEIQRINDLKTIAVYNVKDFLSTPADPASIWNDLINNKQFGKLKELPINIVLDNIGNPEPFKPQGQAAEPSPQP